MRIPVNKKIVNPDELIIEYEEIDFSTVDNAIRTIGEKSFQSVWKLKFKNDREPIFVSLELLEDVVVTGDHYDYNNLFQELADDWDKRNANGILKERRENPNWVDEISDKIKEKIDKSIFPYWHQMSAPVAIFGSQSFTARTAALKKEVKCTEPDSVLIETFSKEINEQLVKLKEEHPEFERFALYQIGLVRLIKEDDNFYYNCKIRYDVK